MSQTPSSTTRQRRGLFQLIADIPGLIRELIEAEIASLKDATRTKAALLGRGKR